jgi:hypothetical protein
MDRTTPAGAALRRSSARALTVREALRDREPTQHGKAFDDLLNAAWARGETPAGSSHLADPLAVGPGSVATRLAVRSVSDA